MLNSRTGSVEVLAVAELLKRASNILRQAKEKEITYAQSPNEKYFQEDAEISLLEKVEYVHNKIPYIYADREYSQVIDAIAELKEPLNQFFDSVMVMDEDVAVRSNRLALLKRTVDAVRWAADFSELASIEKSVESF